MGQNETLALNGGVFGGVQLRLIVDAVEFDAAGEIQHRLLLVSCPSILAAVCSAAKLPVRGEDVELAVVLAEGRAGVGRAVVVGGLRRSLAPSPTTMVSRMLISLSRSSVKSGSPGPRRRRIMMHIRSAGDILVRMNFSRRRERAQLIGLRHRGHVEVQDQQTMVLVVEDGRDINGCNLRGSGSFFKGR